MTTEAMNMKSPENSAEVGIAVHPLVRLLAYCEKHPKRKLERIGQEVWLNTESGTSCVYAPSFDGEIIAPTHSGGEPLF